MLLLGRLLLYLLKSGYAAKIEYGGGDMTEAVFCARVVLVCVFVCFLTVAGSSCGSEDPDSGIYGDADGESISDDSEV